MKERRNFGSEIKLVIRLYLLIRLRKENQTNLDSLLDKFGHDLTTEFRNQYSESFALISTSSEEYWVRIRFESLIEEAAVSAIYQKFQQIRLTVLRVQTSLNFPEPIDSISAVVTAARLNWKEQDHPTGDEIPCWVPEEFLNSLLVDESLLKLVPRDIGKNFKLLKLSDMPTLFQNKIDDGIIELSQNVARTKLLSQFRNIPTDEKESDIPAVKLVVPCRDMDELLLAAQEAYKDVPESDGVGGRSLLISFCLERNSLAGGPRALFPNASALGLTYARDTEFIKQLLSGNLILKSLVGKSSN